MGARSFLLVMVLFSQMIWGQKAEIDEHFKNIKSSELLILGTFHFANPGLDSYKPKYDINIFSKEKQAELKELIKELKKFAPTKIAVEWNAAKQGKLDSLYKAYLKGNFKLKSNEIYQIGFRLGKLLDHKKLYAVDAPARSFKNDLSEEAEKKKKGYFMKKAGATRLQREMNVNDTYFSLYEKGDKLKTQISLIDYFKVMNNPDVISHNHGHYLIGEFKMGEGVKNDYYGADNAIWWYSRNLRIFQNILNITAPGKDRVFVLIGAGHLPILNFLAEASVDFDFKTFEELLKK
ncbi:DUF5694 domain-containing protein [Tenacibaculum amylolyticum]|uniref:DUF5694 domain-containing protein n=1 Tax=Tenacibaculum amylolyticum TaxID=104269 RepID=UPI003895EDF3